eukprot:6735750-Pyramimonas_sp.AAC.1
MNAGRHPRAPQTAGLAGSPGARTLDQRDMALLFLVVLAHALREETPASASAVGAASDATASR